MQQTLLSGNKSQGSTDNKIRTITRRVFTALHPLDQIAALALEKVGKIRIVDEDDLTAVR